MSLVSRPVAEFLQIAFADRMAELLQIAVADRMALQL